MTWMFGFTLLNSSLQRCIMRAAKVEPAAFNFVNCALAEKAAAKTAASEKATLNELIFIRVRGPLLVPKDSIRSKSRIVTITLQHFNSHNWVFPRFGTELALESLRANYSCRDILAGS